MATRWISSLFRRKANVSESAAKGRHFRNEIVARLFLALLLLGLLLLLASRALNRSGVDVHAAMPEKGGWLPDSLKAEVGLPLKLRLTSDDVLHGFAVGQSGWPAVDVKPGQVTEVTLTFERPGAYIYYCTRWCGPNHWRMRGTIQVTGEGDGEPATVESPVYVALGLDIDAPHPAAAIPDQVPIAARSDSLLSTIPARYFDRERYLAQPPATMWQSLRNEPGLNANSDAELWEAVAFIWLSHGDNEQRQLGQGLYAQNCAACHGATGAGNGVFGQAFEQATDFTSAQDMLGASTAILDGKIRRGGMGTGMPNWGAIFTDEEIDALIAHLWTYQFQESGEGD
jgi:mono/diheme cytochrome c family protein/plastocyanin